MLLPYEKPKDKGLTQKYCRSKIESLTDKPIKPTDSVVCYQLNQNPYEKAYIFNKKYEKLFHKLGKLYQKSDAAQKILIEKKVKKIFATIGLIAFISTFGSSDTIIESNTEKQTDFTLKPTIEQCTACTQELQIKIEEQVEEDRTNFQSIYAEEIEKGRIYDTYIEEYCNYYNLNSEKVIELARNLTNDYDISFQNFIAKEFQDFSNPAAACMRFIYYLNRNDLINEENIEYSLDDFKLPEKIITTPHDNFETLILNNGESFTQYLGRICDYFEYEEKCLALSFVYAEAGQNGSSASRNKNNVSGIMTAEFEVKTFSTLENGMIEHIGNLVENYPLSKYNIYDLETLSLKYNKGDLEERTGWKKNMKDAYDKINAKCEQLFLISTQEDFKTRKLSLK